MTFVLRIFFSGLIALVPSRDGRELTVLLLAARDGHALSDHTALTEHWPLLVARAGRCEGDCVTDDPAISELLLPEGSVDASAALSAALLAGTAWRLSGSDISIVRPSAADGALPPLEIRRHRRRSEAGRPGILPLTATEREDFSWIAEMSRIAPAAAEVDPDVLAPQPRLGLIAARLRLRTGRVFTYRLAAHDGQVTPMHFATMAGERMPVEYTQAVADWLEADIEVRGNAIEVVDRSFDGLSQRTVRLAPLDGVVDVAVLNLPPRSGRGSREMAAAPARHFESFYELARLRPAPDRRPVPFPGGPEPAASPGAVAWSTVHPCQEPRSELLEKLRLAVPAGAYDRTLCPLVQLLPCRP